MGMYNLIEDNVNRFYDIAQNTIGECEHIDEFKNKMQRHEELLSGSSEGEDVEDLYAEMWEEFWSEYATN